MKEINIRIEDDSRSLFSHLRDQGYFLPAYCGGIGTCGKCRVRFLNDPPGAGERDLEIFSSEEIRQGYRLACLVHVKGHYRLELEDSPEEEIRPFDSHTKEEKSDQALAIDLGTTTIAASLVDRETGRSIATLTGINHQRAFGADVISRIEAANRGEGRTLQDLVLSDLSGLCAGLGLGDDIMKAEVPVVISANSTMTHLLQGLSCQGLGEYPFTPVDISLHTYGNMTILPGISTFVGGDIVSGIAACGIDRKEEISMLVDLGTNGEMIIGNKDRILAASTAAGPAFEGGNISCGMAGVAGAIERVEIQEGQNRIVTIGNQPPLGLCGTGVLETTYELVKEKIVDYTGLMNEEYFDQGYPLAPGITFTPKDVREVQLAKAAIRAGIEVLLSAFGISCDQVACLYLAGGFGQKINQDKAVGIGMIPDQLADRIKSVGNTSLHGALMAAVDPGLGERMKNIVGISQEIALSNHQLFNDLYVDHMFFGEEA